MAELSKLALLAVTTALIVGSAWAIPQELAPYAPEGATAIERSLSIESIPIGLSPSAMQVALADCSAAMEFPDALEMRYLSDTDRERLYANCRIRAEQISQLSPTLASAWYTEALALLATEDFAGFNMALARSRIAAPIEPVGAYARVMLAENNLARLDATGETSHAADLHTMVMGTDGQRILAQRYATVPDFRDRLRTVLETVPPEVQRKFLERLNRAVRDAN